MRGQRRAEEILERVRSWEEFTAGVEELSDWVRSEVEPELAELSGVEGFAMEFSSHQSRLKVSPGGMPVSNLTQ